MGFVNAYADAGVELSPRIHLPIELCNRAGRRIKSPMMAPVRISIINIANLLVGKKELKKKGSIEPVLMMVVCNMGRAQLVMAD